MSSATPCAVPPATRDAGTHERGAEELTCRERRIVRREPSDDAAVDDQRRERRRLVDVERRLPAGRGAARVEPALVRDDASRHARDARRAHLLRQHREVARTTASGLRSPSARDRPARSCRPAGRSPRTSVSIRNDGPSAVSAAYVTASFSFDAGRSGSDALREYTASPVARSSANAADAARLTCGTLSARSRRGSRARRRRAAAAAETAETDRATAARTATTVRTRAGTSESSVPARPRTRQGRWVRVDGEDGPPGPYRFSGAASILRSP